MTPDEKSRVEEIGNIAYFAVGALLASPDIRKDSERHQRACKMLERLVLQCGALGVQHSSEPPSPLVMALIEPVGSPEGEEEAP